MLEEINKNRKAFLDMIGFSEGTTIHPLTKCKGFDVVVTGIDGKPEVFTDFSAHPFAGGRAPKLINARTGLASTASGRYQHLLRWWLAYAKLLDLKDFTPASQDAVALQQIKERGALPLIDAGDIPAAIAKCANLWASFPGPGYKGQPQHAIDKLLAAYVDFGGILKA